MQEMLFRIWLGKERNLKARTVGSRISNCRRVQDYEGDLDAHYNADELAGLMDRLNPRKPEHRIPIRGNIYNGTATLKQAVGLYRDFLHAEAAPPGPLTSRRPQESGRSGECHHRMARRVTVVDSAEPREHERVADQHSHHSSFREKLIEYPLVGELFMCSWKSGDCSLEISRPEVDRAGYDLIAENGRCLRHIQLKGSTTGAKTAKQKVHVALAEKPSGCVVWAFLDDESCQLGPFLFFGGDPGQQLPDLQSFSVSKHTKGNAEGVKAQRPNFRDVPKRAFRHLDTLEELWLALFGGKEPCA